MTDARTEARRRIAAAIHRGHCGCADAGPEHEDGDPGYLEQADAVLDLFPDVEWHGFLNASSGVSARRLVLHGSVEPVVPEEPRDA